MSIYGGGFIPVILFPFPNEGPSPGGVDLLTEDGNFLRAEDNQKLQTES